MADLTAFGGKSKTIFLNEAEAKKLHLAFTVADGVVVKRGMPLKLTATGEVTTVIGDGTDAHQIIGYSIHNGVEGDEITLAMRGFACIFATARTAIVPGAVIYKGLNVADSDYSDYDDTGATAANYNGWSIDAATNLNDPIRVVLK